MRRVWRGMLGVVMLGVAMAVRAQAPTGPAAITERLSGADARQVTAAVAQIDELLAGEPATAAAYLRSSWVRLLMDQKRYADAARLAQAAILAAPEATASVEALQRARVLALIQDQRSQEALAAAKGLFNVATLATTDAALLLVAECLNRAHPEDAGVVERFIAEQMAGARVPEAAGTGPATEPVISGILRGIQVDVKVYEPALARLSETLPGLPPTTMDLWGRGNLLLLADRPAEARVLFAQIVQRADYWELPAAHDAVARCLKAEDGTIGRANGYVLALRKAAEAKR